MERLVEQDPGIGQLRMGEQSFFRMPGNLASYRMRKHKMKYNIPNEDYDEKFDELNKKIKDYFLKLIENNEQE